jgi:mono/diheme cytochrome c family protein
MTRSTRTRFAIGLALALGFAAIAYSMARTGSSTPYTRGAALVSDLGCIACHGGPGAAALANPSHDSAIADGTVPPLIGCAVDASQFAEWVLLGAPDRLRASPRWRATHAARAIQMPAFQGHLDDLEVADIRAWALIAARSQARPSPAATARWSRAEALAAQHGCFACHGELGQGGMANPGSLTGEIPALVGADFHHLTNSSEPAAIAEWIQKGHSERFLAGNPLAPIARYFMSRQLSQMPAFAAVLSEEEVDLLVDYCLHLHDLGPLDAHSYDQYRASASSANEADKPQTTDTPAIDIPPAEALPVAIAALFSEACIHCHGPKKQESEYRLDTRAAAFSEGDIASYLEVDNITPGNPLKSLLYTFIVLTEEDPENELFPMPPDEEDHLTTEQVQLIHDWIAAGAPWHPSQKLTNTHSD